MLLSPASERVGMSSNLGNSGNAPDSGWRTSTGSIAPYGHVLRLAQSFFRSAMVASRRFNRNERQSPPPGGATAVGRSLTSRQPADSNDPARRTLPFSPNNPVTRLRHIALSVWVRNVRTSRYPTASGLASAAPLLT